jgi:hypothetical protein
VRIRDEDRDGTGRFPDHERHDRLGLLELHAMSPGISRA